MTSEKLYETTCRLLRAYTIAYKPILHTFYRAEARSDYRGFQRPGGEDEKNLKIT